MRDSTAPRVVVPTRREVEIVPVRVVWNQDSFWNRLRRQVRLVVSHERFGESLLVVITFVLVGVLFVCLHHAVEAPRLSPGYAFGIVPH